MEVKEIKEYFKKEIESIIKSDDAFFFCTGYIVALQRNALIKDKEYEQLRKYILRRAKRREQ